jgi:hypothetical protein
MNNYEVIYNVSLLDDIHNYFPALLYDTGRFNDISSVFHYIRSQMNSRFNLYSYGASQFTGRRTGNPIRTTTVPPTPPPTVIPAERQTPHLTQIPSIRRSTLDTQNIATTALLLSMLGSDFTPTLGTRTGTTILNAGALPFFPGFAESVLVRPTQHQIESGSELIEGILNQSCAVCQDVIVASDPCRRIRHCGHTYHRNCIDQWFERNVRCPVCRHDIRDNDETEEENDDYE